MIEFKAGDLAHVDADAEEDGRVCKDGVVFADSPENQRAVLMEIPKLRGGTDGVFYVQKYECSPR